MSVRCRAASSTSVASDEQSFLTGRQTYREDVGFLPSGLSMPIASDESSIYNAVRASSDTDRYSLTRGTDNPMDEILVGGMAANLAMFIPLASSSNDSHPQFMSPRHKSKSRWWRTHLLSDNCLPSSSNVDKHPDNSRVIEVEEVKESHDEARHRKAASLNDADGSLRISKWPGRRLSPVRPAIPKFPPPVRSPTPPGLPTFGTQEAMCYSTQFFVRSFARGGQSQRGHPLPPDARAVNGIGTSYRETLRRLIGFSSPTPTPPLRKPIPIIRAEDGTAVLGRFPYRQSGHAHCDVDQERTRLAKPRCPVRTEALNSCTPTAPETRVQDSSNIVQSAPYPTVTQCPRNPSITMLFKSQRLSSGQPRPTEPQSSRNLISNNEPYVRGPGRVDEPSQIGATVRSPNPSGIAAEPRGSWLQYWKSNTSMCCCLGSNHEQDDAVYSHSSNETYTTARSWVGNEGALDGTCTYTRRACQTQRLGQWCSNAWISFHGIAFRNSATTQPPAA
ncbi:uncharacterized protein ACLA_050500 [Aspergillus clavatus NRRL 1]|uniref:Uncharacterized protein n=1 Tax=Aspergillus clavatus (strain ATCC 1007 / CBS 513.65 / DSM 816 / NCTC 3887 / NRRL 1 / QM 1276 / 107) TaxID=344612 RepID=A1CI73_ASPCL|nr:uncharacterized protein ACLA_050500 [Aspergillus clavatus NRRL 1]EAW10578.1 hypothetical protein ACLA_050500 [Aspergillus clavatus NRRL 1]